MIPEYFKDKTPRLINSNEGFSLIELIAVISILSTLASLGISNVTRWMNLAKIDEAIVVLNNSLVECLALSRSGADLTTVAPPPEVIDNNRLEPTNYIIKNSQNKCSDFFITSKNSDEKLLFEMGYKINADSNVTKIGFPADNKDSLVRCKRWAGPNCGASQEQIDAWALNDAIVEARIKCNSDFDKWANPPGNDKPKGTTNKLDGPVFRWDSSKEPQLTINNVEDGCSLKTYVFEGQIQSSQDVVEQMITDKRGKECDDAVKVDLSAGVIGEKTYPNVCGDQTFYLCGEVSHQTAAEMNNCKSALDEAACNTAKTNARESGESKYEGTGGPGVCSKTFYFCENKDEPGKYFEFEMPAGEDAYNETCSSSSDNEGNDDGNIGGGGGEKYTEEQKAKGKSCVRKVDPRARGSVEELCKYFGENVESGWGGCCTYGFYQCMDEGDNCP